MSSMDGVGRIERIFLSTLSSSSHRIALCRSPYYIRIWPISKHHLSINLKCKIAWERRQQNDFWLGTETISITKNIFNGFFFAISSQIKIITSS